MPFGPSWYHGPKGSIGSSSPRPMGALSVGGPMAVRPRPRNTPHPSKINSRGIPWKSARSPTGSSLEPKRTPRHRWIDAIVILPHVSRYRIAVLLCSQQIFPARPAEDYGSFTVSAWFNARHHRFYLAAMTVFLPDAENLRFGLDEIGIRPAGPLPQACNVCDPWWSAR
jgi:hypothetical protein